MFGMAMSSAILQGILGGSNQHQLSNQCSQLNNQFAQANYLPYLVQQGYNSNVLGVWPAQQIMNHSENIFYSRIEQMNKKPEVICSVSPEKYSQAIDLIAWMHIPNIEGMYISEPDEGNYLSAFKLFIAFEFESDFVKMQLTFDNLNIERMK